MDRQPIPKEALTQEFQWVLWCLEQRYGAALHVNVTDAAWVQISVENIPAAVLAEQLQSERKSLFGTLDRRMQVIVPQRLTTNEISLHVPTEPVWDVGRFYSK